MKLLKVLGKCFSDDKVFAKNTIKRIIKSAQTINTTGQSLANQMTVKNLSELYDITTRIVTNTHNKSVMSDLNETQQIALDMILESNPNLKINAKKEDILFILKKDIIELMGTDFFYELSQEQKDLVAQFANSINSNIKDISGVRDVSRILSIDTGQPLLDDYGDQAYNEEDGTPINKYKNLLDIKDILHAAIIYRSLIDYNANNNSEERLEDNVFRIDDETKYLIRDLTHNTMHRTQLVELKKECLKEIINRGGGAALSQFYESLFFYDTYRYPRPLLINEWGELSNISIDWSNFSDQKIDIEDYFYALEAGLDQDSKDCYISALKNDYSYFSDKHNQYYGSTSYSSSYLSEEIEKIIKIVPEETLIRHLKSFDLDCDGLDMKNIEGLLEDEDTFLALKQMYYDAEASCIVESLIEAVNEEIEAYAKWQGMEKSGTGEYVLFSNLAKIIKKNMSEAEIDAMIDTFFRYDFERHNFDFEYVFDIIKNENMKNIKSVLSIENGIYAKDDCIFEYIRYS